MPLFRNSKDIRPKNDKVHALYEWKKWYHIPFLEYTEVQKENSVHFPNLVCTSLVTKLIFNTCKIKKNQNANGVKYTFYFCF